ncbi:hypothetical protein ACWGJX_46725 [Streptomyces sp. NPDC054775]
MPAGEYDGTCPPALARAPASVLTAVVAPGETVLVVVPGPAV